MPHTGSIVFFGSGAFGVPTLRALAGRLVGVVTQPDRPAGRGGKLTPTPVAQFAAESLPGVPILKPEKVNVPEVAAQIRSWPADVWMVIAFGQKLGKDLLADRFAINLHASLLPRWRGAAPINAAILAGDKQTGNSVITLAERMDAGEVLGQSRREIPPTMTAGELHDALAADGPVLVAEVLEQFRAGTLRREAQDESRVTLAPKLVKADGALDWSRDADECRRRINGLSPWPGVTVHLAGEQLKLVRASTRSGDEGPAQPGELVNAEAGLFRCGGTDLLHVLEVQPAGKRAMAWADFARGRRLAGGERAT